jgi:hypothetical protein
MYTLRRGYYAINEKGVSIENSRLDRILRELGYNKKLVVFQEKQAEEAKKLGLKNIFEEYNKFIEEKERKAKLLKDSVLLKLKNNSREILFYNEIKNIRTNYYINNIKFKSILETIRKFQQKYAKIVQTLTTEANDAKIETYSGLEKYIDNKAKPTAEYQQDFNEYKKIMVEYDKYERYLTKSKDELLEILFSKGVV